MTETKIPQRLDIRHLRNHALKAIRSRRLGVAAYTCLLGIDRDDTGAVVIHVNSGGNVCAVEQWLNLRGYRAEYTGYDPDVYGGKVRVTLRAGIVRAYECGTTEPAAPDEAAGGLSQVGGGGSGI